ncbi:unnamed protein product, partial [Diamesa serratosioi]
NKFIPTNIGNFINLTAFYMEFTQLIAIKSQDFFGMENLEYLSFWNNKLSSIPSDAFAKLTKLKRVNLKNNQIEELSYNVFQYNLQLEQIRLGGNKIKFIGSGIFDHLTQLAHVDLRLNICASKLYNGTTAIMDFKNDVKLNCNIQNAHQFTTLSLNPVEVSRIEINEIKQKLFDMKEHQSKDRLAMHQLILEKNALKIDLEYSKNAQNNERVALEAKNQHLMNNFNNCSLLNTNLEQTNVELNKKLSTTKNAQKTQREETTQMNLRISKLEQEKDELNEKLITSQNDQQLLQEDMIKLYETDTKLQLENAKLIKDISTSNEFQKSQQIIMMQSMGEVLKFIEQRRLDQLTIDNLKQELSDAKEELKKNSIEFESNQNELMNNFTLLNQKDREASTELLTICESKNKELLNLNSFTMNCGYADTDGAYT